MECSNIIARSLNFRAPLSQDKNTQNRSFQNFPFNQWRADDYVQRDVQLQSEFNNRNIGSVNLFWIETVFKLIPDELDSYKSLNKLL